MPETIRYRIASGQDPLAVNKRRKKDYGRMVIQKGLDGCVVKRHKSLPEAAAQYENRQAALKAIWRVLNGQRKSYKGYCWVYV